MQQQRGGNRQYICIPDMVDYVLLLRPIAEIDPIDGGGYCLDRIVFWKVLVAFGRNHQAAVGSLSANMVVGESVAVRRKLVRGTLIACDAWSPRDIHHPRVTA